jgi:hypothetical protein
MATSSAPESSSAATTTKCEPRAEESADAANEAHQQWYQREGWHFDPSSNYDFQTKRRK